MSTNLDTLAILLKETEYNVHPTFHAALCAFAKAGIEAEREGKATDELLAYCDQHIGYVEATIPETMREDCREFWAGKEAEIAVKH